MVDVNNLTPLGALDGTEVLAVAKGSAGYKTTLSDVLALSSDSVRWVTQPVRTRSTANIDLSNGLENGDTVNGVVLAAGDHVLVAHQAAPAQNGIYTVPASGPASRATFADTAAELARIGCVIREGADGIGERWTLPLAASAISLGATALEFALIGLEPGYGTEVADARGAEPTLGARVERIEPQYTALGEIAAAGQISYWSIDSDMQAASGLVSRWQGVGGNILEASGRARPSHMGDHIRFDGTAQLIEHPNDISSRLMLREMVTLPDGNNGAPSGGFTCTGMTTLPDGTRLIMNDGRPVEPSSDYQPSMVITKPDFRAIHDEVILGPLYSGIESVQGCAWDTSDGTIWFADTDGQAIRHIQRDGTPITADAITGLSYVPNGLAYDPADDALWICTVGGAFEKRSCASGSALDSFSLSIAPDHLWYDSASKHIWATAGNNGADGTLYIIDTISRGYVARAVGGLLRSQAIEGLIVEKSTRPGLPGRLYAANDGGFHTSASPPLNLVNAYDFDFVPPKGVAGTKFALAAVLRRRSLDNPGGDALRAIMSHGNVSNTSFGWALGVVHGADRLYFWARQANQNYRLTWPVTSLNAWTAIEIVMEPGSGVALYENGSLVSPSSTTGSAASITLPLNPFDVRIGGQRAFGAAANGHAPIDLKGIGLFGADTDVTNGKISGWQAHRFGLTGLLDGGHPYKAAPPSF